jgi:hypothetical protein
MSDAVERLAHTLEEALALLEDTARNLPASQEDEADNGTLLQQCLAMCEPQERRQPEPVRTVHHFACTGGTLICKCIASMPNVQLLSEVDPLSPQVGQVTRPRFAPTDLVTLMRQSTCGADDALVLELFQTGLKIIHRDAVDRGQRLVLRDHAHSHFCHGTTVPDRPTLRDMVQAVLPVRSVVTVRHPLESFAALLDKAWVHFAPDTLDEYCRRYGAFLDRHDGVRILRYEDFVSNPATTAQQICVQLDLVYSADFDDLFGVHRLTGDSGRAGEVIEARALRPSARTLLPQALQSPDYLALVERMGYPAKPAGGGA